MKNHKYNDNKLKVLIIGTFKWPWYQEDCARCIEKLGYNVARFKWEKDATKIISVNRLTKYKILFLKIINHHVFFPKIIIVNLRLIKAVFKEKPEILWFYNAQTIYPYTVKIIKKILPAATLCQYSNDNPFSKNANPKIWKKYLKSINFHDLHFAYREDNIKDYHACNAKNSYLLRSYFIPEEDCKISLKNIPKKFQCDVVFVGHYENDNRLEMLEEILKAGYNLKIYGPGWEKAIKKQSKPSILNNILPIKPIYGSDYQKVICGSKVALCFLSKLNKDTYTRRNFQIPAMKTVMLSERTKDLINIFEENLECMFFSDKDELLSKLADLLNDTELRKKISEAAYKKVYKAKHDINSRMSIFMQQVETWHKINKTQM